MTRTASHSTVAYYERYRLGYPDRLIAAGRGAVGAEARRCRAGPGHGHRHAGDPFCAAGHGGDGDGPGARHAGGGEAAARAAGVTVRPSRGSSDDLTPGMGPFKLVTMGRSFHWMDRAATLAMLDQIVAPGGGVALFHDAHPPVEENRWFKVAARCRRQVRPRAKRRTSRNAKAAIAAMSRSCSHRPSPQLDGLSVTIRQPLDHRRHRRPRAFPCRPVRRDRLGERQRGIRRRADACLARAVAGWDIHRGRGACGAAGAAAGTNNGGDMCKHLMAGMDARLHAAGRGAAGLRLFPAVDPGLLEGAAALLCGAGAEPAAVAGAGPGRCSRRARPGWRSMSPARRTPGCRSRWSIWGRAGWRCWCGRCCPARPIRGWQRRGKPNGSTCWRRCRW